jgi:hypothetical protein
MAFKVKKNKTKEIPAYTLSGGKLKNFGREKAVKEYRVWIHPKGKDDYYYALKNKGELIAVSIGLGIQKDVDEKKIMRVENPLAVVWDKKFKNYREVRI